MANVADKVFGAEIILQDHSEPVTNDASIGLYNITSDLSGNAASGQKVVDVDDGTIYVAGDVVTITDDNASETNIIDSISVNELTMKTNLANAYATADNAKVDGNSVFRWLQNTISGVTGWAAGVLTNKGISTFGVGTDLRDGGNTAEPGASRVKVKNTNQFFNSLQSKGIYLSGRECRIYEFVDTTKTRKWTGFCEKPTWTSKEYAIPLKQGTIEKRKSNLSTLITNALYPNAIENILEKAVPVTLGIHKPLYDNEGNKIYDGFAKFQRVANKETIFKLGYGVDLGDNINGTFYIEGGDNFSIQAFPVVGNGGGSPPIVYKIKLCVGVEWREDDNTPITTGSKALAYFTDKYIHAVEGTGSGDSSYRKIVSALVDIDADPTIIEVTLAAYYPVALAGNATATETDNTWVEILEVAKEFEADVWKCKSFLDANGDAITQGAVLYDYDKDTEKFSQVARYGYDIDTGDVDVNKMIIDVTFSADNLDTLLSFLVSPCESVKLHDSEDNLDKFSLGGVTKLTAGVFGQADRTTITTIPFINNGTVANVKDKDHSTYLEWLFTFAVAAGLTTVLYRVIEINPPELPKDFSFDNCYLGMLTKTKITNVTSGAHQLYWKRWAGNALEIAAGIAVNDLTTLRTLENLPDFYYTTDYSAGKDVNFYVPVNSNALLAGYVNYEISGITSVKEYNTLFRAYLISARSTTEGAGKEDTLQLFQLAMIFKKEFSIKERLYSPFSGRVFNDTWGGRKTAADVMLSPIDMLEHVCRLQNWSENNAMPSAGWGKGYPTNPLIKVTGDGSFDATDPEFASLSSYWCARQIPKYNDCYTDKLKRSLCKNFFLGNYINKDGFECVKRIIKYDSTPTDTITLADIVDRKAIRIVEPAPSNIYPEPFVRYNQNPETGEFQGKIHIKNTSAEVYDSSYVEGLTGSQAEEYWDRCKVLWNKSKQLNKPSSDLTDIVWANGLQGKDMAVEYLTNWIDWMHNPRIFLKVHYSKLTGGGTVVNEWEALHQFTIQLPHQTNNVALKCILEKKFVDPNPPYFVTLQAIIFFETIPADFNYKDTWQNFGDGSDWVDTMDVKGNDNDKIDKM